MNTEVMFSKKSDCWRTPQELFRRYDRIYSFNIDGAADRNNWLHPTYYGPGGLVEDALTTEWSIGAGTHPAHVWLNPPYSMVKSFVAKAAAEAAKGVLTVALLPARTDTRWFHEHIYNNPHVRVEFLKGRLKFLDEHGKQQTSAPFPSMIVTFFPF